MNLQELRRRLRADYEEKRNIEDLRQRRASQLIYLNHPQLKKLENDYKQMNLELLRGLIESPQEEAGILPQLEELEKSFLEEKRKFLESRGYSKDPRDPQYQCELCRDTGSGDQGMCICFKQRLAQEIFQSEYERGPGQPSLSQMDFSIY